MQHVAQPMTHLLVAMGQAVPPGVGPRPTGDHDQYVHHCRVDSGTVGHRACSSCVCTPISRCFEGNGVWRLAHAPYHSQHPCAVGGAETPSPEDGAAAAADNNVADKGVYLAR